MIDKSNWEKCAGCGKLTPFGAYCGNTYTPLCKNHTIYLDHKNKKIIVVEKCKKK